MSSCRSRYNPAMAGITLDDTLNSGFGWALWKVLDYLSARFMPGSLLDSPQRAASTAAASDPISTALAALQDIDPTELQAALASLGDDESPLVQCLAWALGTKGIPQAERQQRLEASMTVLSRAECFALLAVLLYQTQAAAAASSN